MIMIRLVVLCVYGSIMWTIDKFTFIRVAQNWDFCFNIWGNSLKLHKVFIFKKATYIKIWAKSNKYFIIFHLWITSMDFQSIPSNISIIKNAYFLAIIMNVNLAIFGLQWLLHMQLGCTFCLQNSIAFVKRQPHLQIVALLRLYCNMAAAAHDKLLWDFYI